MISGYSVEEIELCHILFCFVFSAQRILLKEYFKPNLVCQSGRGSVFLRVCVCCEGGLGDLQGTGVGVSIYSATAH